MENAVGQHDDVLPHLLHRVGDLGKRHFDRLHQLGNQRLQLADQRIVGADLTV